MCDWVSVCACAHAWIWWHDSPMHAKPGSPFKDTFAAISVFLQAYRAVYPHIFCAWLLFLSAVSVWQNFLLPLVAVKSPRGFLRKKKKPLFLPFLFFPFFLSIFFISPLKTTKSSFFSQLEAVMQKREAKGNLDRDRQKGGKQTEGWMASFTSTVNQKHTHTEYTVQRQPSLHMVLYHS